MAAAVRASWLGALRTFFLSHPYSLLGAIFVIVLAVPVFQREQDWVTVYIPAAVRLMHGEDIFHEESGFVYPPINAWMALPFVDLPRVPTVLLWHALNMAALAILILGAWKLSGGGRLEVVPRTPWREHVIFWLGLGCGISSCLDAVTNQQTDLIVAALVILGCLALMQQRDGRAGLWFGVAAAIKCTPLLWAPYLAWQKRWIAALLVVVVAAGVNLLPDLTHPPATSGTRVIEWTQRFLRPMAERKHDFGSWHCGVGGNQSVAGIWQRWLVYDTAWHGNNLIGVPRASRVGPETLKAVSWSSLLLLLTAGVACSWKASVSGAGPSPSTAALQFGMVLILMVLMSPHSSKPHFCTLLLPGFCVARAALNWPNRRLLYVLAAAIVLALVSNQDLVGEWLYSWTKWNGSLAWCAVLLYGASCRILLGRQMAAATPALPIESDQTMPVRQAA